MISPTLSGFMRGDLGEGGFNPAFLQRSRPIYQDSTGDIQGRMDQLLRGEFGDTDPAQFLLSLQTDLLQQLNRAQTSTGIPVREDLEAPALQIVPLDTPFRNRLPRTVGSSTASSWEQEVALGGGYGVNTTITSGTSSATQTVASTAGMQPVTSLYFAVTAAYRTVVSVTNTTTVVLNSTISTNTTEGVFQGPYAQPGQAPVQMFFAEDGAPATAKATYAKLTLAYKLLGTIGSITGFAMAAGATYQNQRDAEILEGIRRTMLSEENGLINGSSTILTAPWGDGTTNFAFDGCLNQTTTANGTPGQQVQTAVGALTTAHMDQQLTRIHNEGGMDAYIIANAQEALSLAHLATASGSIIRVEATSSADMILGGRVIGYKHPITGQIVPIEVSRFMPAGTMWFGSERGPDGMVAADVRVLPQVQLPELAPNVNIQGYVAQELAPTTAAPQVYAFLISVFETLRIKNAKVVAKSSGLTPV